jgi:hypothetical protein
MMILVCSGWNPQGARQYGDNFLKSFALYWPADVQFMVYTEEPQDLPRGVNKMLFDIPGAAEFYARHFDNPILSGRQPGEGHSWKKSCLAKGYNFRYDALKFFKQILIPRDAARWLDDGDILIWLDGDVVTTAKPDIAAIKDGLRGADVMFLNRAGTHSEIGFWAVRISNKTRNFLSVLAETYTDDQFLEMREYHSAFIWDAAREACQLSEHHLVKSGQSGHVWPHSMLGKWSRHEKGDRKGK